jgi:multimeric flavodoxin WrbA
MKRVLILTSSPVRGGNTNAMASAFEEAARKKGAAVTRLDMNKAKGCGCTACMACRKTAEWCVIQDGVGEALAAFRDADLLVLAAPVWWLDLPVALRRFVERWHGLVDASFTPRLPAGKAAVLLLSQGAGAESFQDLPARYREMLDWLGVKEFHAVRHCLAEENPIGASGVLAEVAALAESLA